MQRPVLPLPVVLAFAIGLTLGVVAGVGLVSLFQSRVPSDGSAELAVANSHLSAGDVQGAYDALLAAMRVAPGDERVFDASLEFVRKASSDSNDEGVPLAHDVHQRVQT